MGAFNIIVLIIIMAFPQNIQLSCNSQFNYMNSYHSRTFSNNNSKIHALTQDIINKCNYAENLNDFYNINDFIALTLSALGFKRFIVLYETATTVSETDIHNSQFYEYVTELHTYSVARNTLSDTLRSIFAKENVNHEIYHLCIGSFTFLKGILNLVNNIDHILNQQGYVSHLHKWILIDQGPVACSNKLLFHIDKIDNVACIKTRNEFLERDIETNVFTAMFGDNLRYWQHVQCLYPFPKMTWSVEDIFPNTQFKLNNRHFKIGTNIVQGYVYLDHSGQYRGAFIDILRDLARNLNFTYDIVLPKDKLWGVLLANGSWNGFVGELARREIDFIVAPLARNQYREQVIDYADYDIFKYHVAGVYKLPSRKITSLNLYVKPFDLTVYIGLIISVIVAGLLSTLRDAYYDANNSFNFYCNNNGYIYLRYYFDNVFRIITSLLGQPNVMKSAFRYRHRSINFGIICMSGIVLVTLWTAKIVSYLTVYVQAVPIKTFDDLLNQNTYTFGMNGASNAVIQISQSTDERDKRLWEKLSEIARHDPDVLSTSEQKRIEKLQQGNFVFIGPEDVVRNLANQNCEYVLTQEEYKRNGVALGLQNNSAYKSYFNEFTLRMIESGIIDRMRKYAYPVTKCYERVHTDHKPILFEVVLPVFYGLFCIAFVAFFVLLFEMVTKK